MVLTAITMMMKTFYFLRLLNSMSFLVSMLQQVIVSLKPFLVLLVIFYIGFAVILGVIDWGQYEYDDNPVVRKVQYTSTGPDKEYM